MKTLRLDAMAVNGCIRSLANFAAGLLTSHSQYIVNDPMVSNRHLHIYSMLYDNNQLKPISQRSFLELTEEAFVPILEIQISQKELCKHYAR